MRAHLSVEEEVVYIRETINSPDLCRYIEENSRAYDFFIFIPYMFGTTFYGTLACPEKSILIPCLHDESYAYMSIYREMFDRVRALIFHVEWERRLAMKLFGVDEAKCHLIGEGVDADFQFDGDRFRRKYKIQSPFLVYAGRKDSTKNTPLLVNCFSRYLERNDSDLKLVLLGPGEANIPRERRSDILDLGFVPTQDKYDAFNAALLLCQPSVNESFSLVIMEAWLCGTPVLVHGDCGATREHCTKSNGGFCFTTCDEFEAHLRYFERSNPSAARKMGASGKRYVLDNYQWKEITKKIMALLGTLKRTNDAPTVNIMTASFREADAIGDYIGVLRRFFQSLGHSVRVFADHGEGDFQPSSAYRSTGRDILWYHYSIHAENLACIKKSKDFKVMDFHGVTPPALFEGYNPDLVELTRKGNEAIGDFVEDFDLCVVHSDYTFGVLEKAGCGTIVKSPLVVNEKLVRSDEDPLFAEWLEQIDYLLFVGRIVPQKDIPSIVRLFHSLKKSRPDLCLFLVGGDDVAPDYTWEIQSLIQSLGLENRVLFTGAIRDHNVLSTFFKYAKFHVILSEWETFCVPIVESMFFKVPVIGIDKTCVPETIGDAGVVLENLDDFDANAAIVNRLWDDEEAYEGMRRKCAERGRTFLEANLRARLTEIMETHLAPVLGPSAE